MPKTYLEIVNDCISESKVSLDPLEAADWANPPRTVMYNNFKRFVARAYKDLMIRRPEWQFRIERATVTVWPRLHLSGLTYVPSPGDILQGQSSGTRFTVIAVHDFEDVEESADVERTLDVEYSDDSDGNNVILNEAIERVTPSPATDVGFVKGRGRYNFEGLVPSLEELNTSTVTIQPAVAYADNPTAGELQDAYDVSFIPWDSYRNYFDQFSGNLGRPGYIGRALDGNYDFYPRPNAPYDISFEYTQIVTQLVNPTDIPGQIPERYEDYIMWAALADYADYDERPKVFARAQKHVNQFIYWLERDKLPEMKVNIYRFDQAY